jgi:hypothetical protein
MTHSKGISWIDDCRIPTISQKEINWTPQRQSKNPNIDLGGMRAGQEQSMYNSKGRFPANLLVCDDMLNDGVISKSVKGRNDIGSSTYGGNSLLNSKTKMNNTDRGFNDKGSNSRYYNIDKWFENLIK